IMYTGLQGLKEMIDVNTIVGDPINSPDGTVIIPVSKVGIGFGVGGSEFEHYNSKKSLDGEPRNMFGGATGGGISLTPEGFLVVGNGKIRMISVNSQSGIYDRLLDLAPAAIDKVAEIFKKPEADETATPDATPKAPADDTETFDL
ncbi:MAG: GerW family sporulation protein, partial [Clostridia bacterium]|nr:GerW family sporulation protein [Clostridia bacterium]